MYQLPFKILSLSLTVCMSLEPFWVVRVVPVLPHYSSTRSLIFNITIELHLVS